MSRPHAARINAALPELVDLRFPLPALPQDVAEDLPYEEQVEYFEDAAENLPLEMTQLWQQFLSDLLQKCGNLRGAGVYASHCRLSMRERQDITQEAMADINLAGIFNRVQYRTPTRKEWAAAFDRYFSPLDGKTPVQLQNFPQMLYWMRWAELKALLPNQAGHMRQRLRLLFDQLCWVPQTASDRVWLYQRDDHFQIFPHGCTLNAPQILLNPSFGQPQWNPPPGVGEDHVNAGDAMPQPRARGPQPIPYAHLQQEEEESSG